ncbi:MAG: glycosyltransferase WbuB [Phycisphaerae bacterium]
MKLLIITQYFPPEMGAPQARLSELARRLQSMGHEITVLTAMPNYPTGRVFEGYRRRLRVTEQRDGMRVIRTWVWPSKSSRMLPRLFCYLSFALSCLVLGHWGIGKQNLVMIETPPLFLPPFGLLIGKLKRARTVLMIADIWPDILVQMGHAREGPALRMMYRLERFCYEHANGVALTTPGMWSQVRERFPHLPNVTLISNGVDTGLFRPAARDLRVREELGAGPDQLLVGYCGLHGLAQGLEIVLDAAERLKDRHDIRFVMIGDGPTKEAVVQKARELNLPGVRLQDQRPKSDMPAIVASLDVSLMPLGVRIPGAMPSKVYEAMASGAVPVVAKGTDADRLLTEHQAGLSYEPGDLNGLVECIAQLAEDRNVLRNLRQNAIQLAQRFDRRVLAERSAAVLTAIAEGRPAPPVLW